MWIPYWIISICVLPLKAYDGALDVFLDLTLVSPNFSLGWYLNYLLLWYVVFWVLHRFIGDDKNTRLIVMCIITVGLMVYYGFKSGLRFEQSFAFPLGVVMANYEDKAKKVFKGRVVIILLAVGVILLGLKQTSYVRNLPDLLLNILNLVMKESVGIGLVIGTVVVFESKNWISIKGSLVKILVPIGLASYELYLVHGYALKIFDLSISKELSVLIFIGISMVGTTLFYFVENKIVARLKRIVGVK